MKVSRSALTETLALELERPRELTSQVLRHIAGTFDTHREGVGAFLSERVAGLEDDDIDLLFSPLFTPRLADQVPAAVVLGREAVRKEDWPGLVAELAARPVEAQLTMDGAVHRVSLRAVTIERYVFRLRLDGAIPEELFSLVGRAPEADRPMLTAIARRAVWEPSDRRGILEQYLANAFERGSYALADAIGLLDLAEAHKPASADRLLTQLPVWQETLKRVLDTGLVGPSPFFSAHTEHQHGGDRDHRVVDQSRVQAKRNDLALLIRLEQVLKPA